MPDSQLSRYAGALQAILPKPSLCYRTSHSSPWEGLLVFSSTAESRGARFSATWCPVVTLAPEQRPGMALRA